MTGAEKIKEMVDSGKFAEKVESACGCPDDFGLKQDEFCAMDCESCWRKAQESEVGE
jgi:hypothetical protein